MGVVRVYCGRKLRRISTLERTKNIVVDDIMMLEYMLYTTSSNDVNKEKHRYKKQ